MKDFTEVDNNVTRNIAGELQNNDWGLMVLHYLGLDHIGHKAGPRRYAWQLIMQYAIRRSHFVAQI